MSNIDWYEDAACRGLTRYFFGHYSERPETKAKREVIARKICKDCPVMIQCRDHARATGEMGFWGGESEDERFEAGFIRDRVLERRQRAREKRNAEREIREKAKTS